MAKIPLRAYVNEIETIIDQQQTEEAIAHCRHILQIYPKHIDTYRMLGKAYLESQRYKDASDIFERVLSAIPYDFVSHVGISITREHQDNLNAAIWHMERAFEGQPYNAAIQGELRRLFGKRDGMEPPKIHLTRGALARMYAKGNLYQQAIAEFRAALAEDPQRFDLEVFLAEMYQQQGDTAKAIESCGRILKKLPFCLDANQLLVDLLETTNRADEAEVYKKRIQELDPYQAHVSKKIRTRESVKDQAVLVEQLIWDGGPAVATEDQSEWPITSNANFGDSKSDALVQQKMDVDSFNALMGNISKSGNSEGEDELIPDFMKDAGWEPSTGTFDESTSLVDYDDDANLGNEKLGAVEGELPEWLQEIAPPNMVGDYDEGDNPDSLLKLNDEAIENKENEDLRMVDSDEIDDIFFDGEISKDIPDWLSEIGIESDTESIEIPAWLKDAVEEKETDLPMDTQQGLSEFSESQLDHELNPTGNLEIPEEPEPVEAVITDEADLGDIEGVDNDKLPEWLQVDDTSIDIVPEKDDESTITEDPQIPAVKGIEQTALESDESYDIEQPPSIISEDEKITGDSDELQSVEGEDSGASDWIPEEFSFKTETEPDLPDWLQDLDTVEETETAVEDESQVLFENEEERDDDLSSDEEPELSMEPETKNLIQQNATDIEDTASEDLISDLIFDPVSSDHDSSQSSLVEEPSSTDDEPPSFVLDDQSDTKDDILPDWLQDEFDPDKGTDEDAEAEIYDGAPPSESMIFDSTDSDNGISESDEISIEDENSSPIPDWLQETEIANVAESPVDLDIPDWILEVSDEQVEGDSGSEPEIANLDDSEDLISSLEEQSDIETISAESLETETNILPTPDKDIIAAVENADIPEWLEDVLDDEEIPEPAPTDDIRTADLTQDATLIGQSQQTPSEEISAPIDLDDPDAAMAWLESLAAKQGVSEDELLTSPEERDNVLAGQMQGSLEEETQELEIYDDNSLPQTIDGDKDDYALSSLDKQLEPIDGDLDDANSEISSGIPDWLGEIPEDDYIHDLDDLNQVESGIDEKNVDDIPEWLNDISDDVPKIAGDEEIIKQELVDSEKDDIPDWIQSIVDEPSQEELIEPVEPVTDEVSERPAIDDTVDIPKIADDGEIIKQELVDSEKDDMSDGIQSISDEPLQEELIEPVEPVTDEVSEKPAIDDTDDGDLIITWLEDLDDQSLTIDEMESSDRSIVADQENILTPEPLDEGLPGSELLADTSKDETETDIDDINGAMAWLDGLGSQLDVTEDELTIEPDERIELASESSQEIEEPGQTEEIVKQTEDPEISTDDIGLHSEGSDVEVSTEEGFDIDDADAAMAWLEGLAAKQSVSEDELLSSPEERNEVPPDWIIESTDFIEQEEEGFESRIPDDTSDSIILETKDSLGSELIEASEDQEDTHANIDADDAAMAWLESLAAKHGVSEDELLTDPGERVDAPPDWVKESIISEKLADSLHVDEDHLPDLDEEQNQEDFPETVIPEESQFPDVSLTPPSWISDGQVPEDEDLSWLPTDEINDDNQLLDLNQASLIQLERLPGIGFRRAQSITAYREEHGDFATLESLLNVPGMDHDTIELLKTRVAILTPAVDDEIEETVDDDLFSSVDSDPDDESHQLQLAAQEKFNEDKIQEALVDYQTLINQGKRLGNVIKDLKVASEKHPADASIFQTLGDAYMKANKLQEALDVYKKLENLL